MIRNHQQLPNLNPLAILNLTTHDLYPHDLYPARIKTVYVNTAEVEMLHYWLLLEINTTNNNTSDTIRLSFIGTLFLKMTCMFE